MITPSNGEAMSTFTSNHSPIKHRRRDSLHKELLAELHFDCRFARNVKKILYRNFSLEFPASAISHIDQARAIENCMKCVTDTGATEAAAVIIAELIEDMADGHCLPDLASDIDRINPSWTDALDGVLQSAPWYVSDCFKNTRMHVGSHGLAMTHSCMSAWIAREGCAWLIEIKGFPRISSSSQALMYLISGNNCHNQIGRSWFRRHPDRARPRSWWFDRHHHLPFFYGAQAASSGTDLFSPAFAN